MNMKISEDRQLLLAADPLADIRNTRRIHRVLKGGEIFDPDHLLRGFR